ncbi:MAG: hypothetical protein BWY77_01862 [bacterium ADurb.Bin431]|nr:MAG: hypothetical protein BWY77_01862 [bacterium ADurb.Bin431]
MQGAGCRIQGAGCRIQDTGCRIFVSCLLLLAPCLLLLAPCLLLLAPYLLLLAPCLFPLIPAQKPRRLVQRLYRRGEADALEGVFGEVLQAFEAEGQVDAALVPGERVDFVHDDGLDGAEHLSRLGAGEQQVERFRCGDEDVRRLAEHRLPVALRGVAGAHRHADVRQVEAHIVSLDANSRQRHAQVAVDVIVKGFQGRDVNQVNPLFDFRFWIFDFRLGRQ